MRAYHHDDDNKCHAPSTLQLSAIWVTQLLDHETIQPPGLLAELCA